MASYTIVADNSPYLTIDVEFMAQTFRQDVIVPVEGKARDKRLQEYADQYEADWLAQNKSA